mgnify:CR=1 FL=1
MFALLMPLKGFLLAQAWVMYFAAHKEFMLLQAPKQITPHKNKYINFFIVIRYFIFFAKNRTDKCLDKAKV